jgi:predicted RNA-binding protein associated with RNAse of E/G family
MSDTEVAELLAALRAGSVSVGEVAAAFRERSWPSATRPMPAGYEELAGQQDPEPDLPGSFDDVTAAYDRGEITRDQYRTLAHAVADSINAEARGQHSGEAE